MARRGSARGHDRDRRRRGVRRLPPRTSNAGDRPGMRPPTASQPKLGRLRVGRRSPGATPRPIDASSFQSPRPSLLASPRDRLDDRVSEPPFEHRIPRRGATSQPVGANLTQGEGPRSPRCASKENLDCGSSERFSRRGLRSWRSGPGGIRRFSIWRCQCPTADELRYNESSRSSRPCTRRTKRFSSPSSLCDIHPSPIHLSQHGGTERFLQSDQGLMKTTWIPHRFHRLEVTFLACTRFCLGEPPRSEFEPDSVGVRTDPLRLRLTPAL